MNYKIRMMSGNTHIIDDKRFAQLSGLSGLVYIPEIGGAINLSSVESILSEEAAEVAESNNPKVEKRVKLKDGLTVVNRHGTWYSEYSGARVDVSYYPELTKDNIKYLN